MNDHVIFDGRVHVYKRDDSRYWQCSAFIKDKNFRVSTKEDSLSKAKDFAEDWYLELRGKYKRGELQEEKTFNEAADQFMKEYPIITEGNRNAVYVKGHEQRLDVHLRPFFGSMNLSQINAGRLQEYRIHRRGTGLERNKKVPARNTIHQEIVTLRQVLKTALRHEWLTHLPDLSAPYKTTGKLSHRAWFSPVEYKKLYEATRERAEKPKRKRWAWESEQLHDYVLFMANTGLRPDEAARLEFRDVTIVEDEDTEETILEIEVRGKRGVGYCKSTAGAVFPFTRLRDRIRNVIVEDAEEGTQRKEARKPEPTDRLFPKGHRELFNAILKELKFKLDREGSRRTAYSLRHTYICLRLMEGADIYQIAKNCRTSVEMIENYYASHIKTSLDAAAINVRRVKKPKKDEKTTP
ncbi:MAG: site-specific integrase [bacterium]|nr:site-specific integrase [bacterium]